MQTILVVDDDKHIRELVKIHLKEAGYKVLEAENGEEALQVLEEGPCDLAVVDVMMPIVDGYELTEDIRDFYDFPVIILTAKDQIEDKEKGFLAGTDDYLVKPFEPKELLFRVRALLRRYEKNLDDILVMGDVTINKKSYEVTIGKQTFLLPLKEFELLFLLASYPKKTFTRIELVEKIWGYDYEGDDRTVDVHIKRLRKRFSDITDEFKIKTVRGVGYGLEVK